MGRLLTLTEISRLLNRDTRNVAREVKARQVQPIAQALFRGKLTGLYKLEQFTSEERK
jgi:hypothetical protein